MEKLRPTDVVNLTLVQPFEIIRDILKLFLIKGYMHLKVFIWKKKWRNEVFQCRDDYVSGSGKNFASEMSLLIPA